MKNIFLSIVLILACFFSLTVFSQSKDKPVSLGLPGDNLDLYAVMEIFQKSKTIEDFEKSLNEDKSGVNNLDLDNDKKVDFIKVVTDKDGDSFSFILQVAVSKTENQDVAVIFVSKEKSGQASIQIVGDEDLYGKNYVVEPKGSGASGNTVNPGYSGGETMNIPAKATTTTVIVQSPPIVQYVYSPAYVPYYPPYYYGYYPPYYRPFVPIAFGVFWANNYHCHGGYYGGYHGSVNININNSHHYNNYNNNSRNRSTTVANNKSNGNYGNRAASGNNNNRGNNISTRPSGGNSASTRPGNGSSGLTRPTSPSTRESGSGMTRPTSPSTRQSGSSTSTRQSSSNNNSRPSTTNNSFNGGSNRSSGGGSSFNGGGRSGGSSGGGGRSGGGGMRGGGGRR